MAATWLGWPYFEAALADAPASARPDTSIIATRIASVPLIAAKDLSIAPSIWFETTQTEQAEVSFFDDSVRVLLSLLLKLIPFLERRKNQPTSARKIRKKERR
jgi:hypothetical protein